jgi:hypothetical protein
LAGIEPMRTSPVDLKRGLADDGHRADLLDQFRSAAQRSACWRAAPTSSFPPGAKWWCSPSKPACIRSRARRS